MPNNGPQHNSPPPSSGDDITKIGALSDGFANTATNSTEIDDGSNGYIGTANGDNRNNYNDSGTHDANNDNSKTIDSNNSTDNSTDVDVNAKIDVAVGNGDDRDNSYDWDYTSKTVTLNDNDTISKTEDSFNKSIENKTEDSYNSKVEDSYNAKTEYKTEDSYNSSTKTVDVDKTEDSYNTKVEDSNNSKIEDSYNSKVEDSYNSDNDFADLDKVLNSGTFGIAGGNLTFDIGDDFSFNMDVGNVLTGGVTGNGFSAIQANHLADQDYASDLKMNNQHADNDLRADGGHASGAEGIDMGHSWDVRAGDDISGASTADASAILANSGFHMELVQGANMLSNAVDATLAGNDVSHVGEDTSGS